MKPFAQTSNPKPQIPNPKGHFLPNPKSAHPNPSSRSSKPSQSATAAPVAIYPTANGSPTRARQTPSLLPQVRDGAVRTDVFAASATAAVTRRLVVIAETAVDIHHRVDVAIATIIIICSAERATAVLAASRAVEG